MKEWKKPEIDELDVRKTASGAVDDTVENTNAGFMNGSWHISSYNASTSEKTSCGDGRYTISPIKTQPGQQTSQPTGQQTSEPTGQQTSEPTMEPTTPLIETDPVTES